MTTVEEIKATLRVLYNNADLVSEAYLDNKGLFSNHPEYAKVIAQLKKQRLVWLDDDTDEVYLANVVNRLFDHALKNFHRHKANEAIASLWNYLNSLLEQYHEAKQNGLTNDRERISGEIQEHGYELIENLAEATDQFSQYLVSRFSYVHDINLRTKENEKVLKQAERLNDLIDSFDLDEIYNMGCNEDWSRKLFRQQITRAIKRCQKELLNSLHYLREMLNTPRENAEYSKLITIFETKYQNNRGFLPDITGLYKIPKILNLAEGLHFNCVANLDDNRHTNILAKLTWNLRPTPIEDPKLVHLHIEDATMLVEEEISPDPIQEAATALVEAAVEGTGVFSALDAYQIFSLDCGTDLWVYALLNVSQALPCDQHKRLSLEFKEDKHPLYPGNFFVRDIILRQQNA